MATFIKTREDLNIDYLLKLKNAYNLSFEEFFKSCAKDVINNICISNGACLYHPIEIEFYVYDKEKHADILVYPRDEKEAGDLFFHLSGIDICFSSSIKEGRFGGILIRALERETDGQQFGGPLICKDEVLNSAKGKCVVVRCNKEFTYDISTVTRRKGFKGPKGTKDIYWDKNYRFVRDNVKKPIKRIEQQINPDTGEIIDKVKTCYL